MEKENKLNFLLLYKQLCYYSDFLVSENRVDDLKVIVCITMMLILDMHKGSFNNGTI